MVNVFDPLCEVQSDKATVEITSRSAGTIVKLYHQPNDLVEVRTSRQCLCFHIPYRRLLTCCVLPGGRGAGRYPC